MTSHAFQRVLKMKTTSSQSDQMARLFVQYLAIYSNEKLEQKQKYFPKKDLNKFLIHPQNIAKETF